MKKFILSAALLTTFGMAAFANNDDKKEAKAAFIENCKAQMPAESGVDQNLVANFCECSSEKVFEKYSLEEIAAIENDNSEEAQMKMMEVIQPCLEDFMQNIQQTSGE